jgi:hypothetical protein
MKVIQETRRAHQFEYIHCLYCIKGRRGRNRMVVCFTTTYAISAYHH